MSVDHCNVEIGEILCLAMCMQQCGNLCFALRLRFSYHGINNNNDIVSIMRSFLLVYL